jgi:hypothetical protein
MDRRSVVNFDRIVFDHGVGEELLAHLGDLVSCGLDIPVGEFKFDELALTDIVDAIEAEAFKRMVDRLALGVEDAVLESYVDACFQRTCPKIWSY